MGNEITSASSTDVKLGFGKQFLFGLGEFAGQFFFSFWGSYLSVFYTDVVGIAPGVASAIFMIARVWDAVNDPMMGSIADHHLHKKLGRYRPWIIFGTPFLALCGILMWYVPKAAGDGVKIVWCAVTYIAAGMLYTLVVVPYMSLQSTLTTDFKTRGNLANMKSAFTFAGTALMNLFAMDFITKLGGGEANERGYFFTAVVFSVVGAIFYYISVLPNKEAFIAEPQKEKPSFKEVAAYIFGNREIVAIMFSLLCSMMCTFGRLGVAVYYYLYCCHAFEKVGLLMVIPTVCTILPTYLIPKINLPRKTLISIAFLGRAISLFALCFVDYTNFTAIVICLVFFGLFNFETGMLAGLIAPAIDNRELETGIRMDGTVYAMVNLFAKLATAIGGALGLLVMGAMGYVANAEQTATALTGINIAANALPGLFSLLGIVPIFFYKLTPEKMAENVKALAARRAAAAGGAGGEA